MNRKLLFALVLFVAGCSADGGSSSSTSTAPPGTDTTVPEGETTVPGMDTTDPGTDTTVPDPEGGVDDLVHRAADVTVHAERFTVDLETRIEAENLALRVTAVGWEDADRRWGDLRFESLHGDDRTTQHIVTDGRTLWAKGTDLADLPDGIEWVRTGDVLLQGGTEQTDGVLQILYGLVGTTGWEEAGDAVSEDGTDVRRFEARSTYGDLVAGAATLDREEQFRSALNLTGPDEILELSVDLRIEVDEDDRIHLLEIRSTDGADAIVDVALTLDLGDFDVDQDAPSPPEGDVTLTGPEADRMVRQVFGATI